MTSSSATPFFLQNSSRKLFVVEFSALSDSAPRGAILHIPAFAEEMNKSRAMIAAQARALAESGYVVLVADLNGTGDSDGEFVDATWESWLEDMRYCMRWLAEQYDAPLILWGLRLGALMAAELAADRELPSKQLVLWNPVQSGQRFMQQFLRLRLVNGMMGDGQMEKMDDLKAVLADSGQLEVAGYELSRDLFNSISARSLAENAPMQVERVLWAEVAPTKKNLSLPAQSVLEGWRSAGINVDAEAVAGTQFWSTQEISSAESLIDFTSGKFNANRE